MRALHRFFSIFALVVLAWLSGSGVIMQLMDLQAILTHAPGNAPTLMSTNEGRYGGGAFAVMSEGDFTAPVLPARFDYVGAFAGAMRTLHVNRPGVPPEFVEARMDGDKPIIQVATGPLVQHGESTSRPMAAFDATTGAPAPGIRAPPVGAYPPPSLRESSRMWHRYFSHGTGPGVWILLVSGLLFWAMIITGLTFYLQMLGKRRRTGHKALFWMGAGSWRSLHRIAATGGVVFLMPIALTGAWLGFDEVWHSLQHVPTHNLASPLKDAQIQRMAQTTLSAFQAREPQTPIKVLRVRIYSGRPQGVIITGGQNEVRQLVFDAESGVPQTLSEAGYPPSKFPLGDQAHETLKYFHSGLIAGVPGRFLQLFGGLCLLFLSLSGLVLYTQMWLARSRLGRRALVWA